MNRDPIAELMTLRAEAASAEIQTLLHGLGMRTQGAVLADLTSMWLAGQFEAGEIGLPIGSDRPLTAAVREMALVEFIELVRLLVPESEKQILQNIEPEGHG
jgi:hypothetical protein